VVGTGTVGLVARVAGSAALCGVRTVEDDDDLVVGAMSRGVLRRIAMNPKTPVRSRLLSRLRMRRSLNPHQLP
jgi:hypothetical protein